MFFIRINDSVDYGRDHSSESELEFDDKEEEVGSCTELKYSEPELESGDEENKDSSREGIGIK